MEKFKTRENSLKKPQLDGAFPITFNSVNALKQPVTHVYQGMLLLDYFAIRIYTSVGFDRSQETAYQFASEMIEARDKLLKSKGIAFVP